MDDRQVEVALCTRSLERPRKIWSGNINWGKKEDKKADAYLKKKLRMTKII